MKLRAIALVAVALLLPLSAAACGDSDSGSGSGGGKSASDLSAEDLSKMMQSGGMPKAQADCIAQAFVDSDLTKADIEAIGEGDTSSFDSATMRKYTKAAVACIGSTETTGG